MYSDVAGFAARVPRYVNTIDLSAKYIQIHTVVSSLLHDSFAVVSMTSNLDRFVSDNCLRVCAL